MRVCSYCRSVSDSTHRCYSCTNYGDMYTDKRLTVVSNNIIVEDIRYGHLSDLSKLTEYNRSRLMNNSIADERLINLIREKDETVKLIMMMQQRNIFAECLINNDILISVPISDYIYYIDILGSRTIQTKAKAKRQNLNGTRWHLDLGFNDYINELTRIE